MSMMRSMVCGRVVGVQGAEDQVAGFGGGDGGAGGFQVAHFADEDHVGVLAEHVAKAAGEIGDVAADFALLDGAVDAGEGRIRSGLRG